MCVGGGEGGRGERISILENMLYISLQIFIDYVF